MKLVFGLLFLLLVIHPADAQERSIVFPVPDSKGMLSAGFFDTDYLREIGVQHLGVDIPAPEGSQVLSPVSGTVILNRTQGVDPLRAYLVIRSDDTGHDHVLAHINSDLADQVSITAGDPVGTIVRAGTGPHLHYGINQSGLLPAIEIASGWGFGQAPAAADASDARARGWIDPSPILAEAVNGSAASANPATSGSASANSIGASPADISAGSQFGSEVGNTGQLDLSSDQSPNDLQPRIQISDLQNGLYGRSPASCALDPETLGEEWGYHFKNVAKPEYSVGYETTCTIRSSTLKGNVTEISASCNAEGTSVDRTDRWLIASTTSFRDQEAYDGPIDYVLCSAQETSAERLPWTETIVHPGGYERQELTRCVFDAETFQSIERCILEDGASDETLRFVQARASEGGGGPVLPIRFQELGKVDIAFLDAFTMNQNEWEYFVNTTPETITDPMYPERDLSVLASRGDQLAQSILSQFPEATAWKPFVGGMRNLPNGHQRFSTVIYWTENCRACSIVGYNVATVDYDLEGKFRLFQVRGIFDNRQFGNFLAMTPSDLTSSNAAVQFYLNLRGYDAGAMDGVIGSTSRRAIEEFQRENGINSGTGQLDQSTLEALVDRETLFQNGARQAEIVLASQPVEDGQPSSQCQLADQSLNAGGIFDELVSKRLSGRTIDGSSWSLWLNDDRPSNFGQASFTDSEGVTTAGTWYLGWTENNSTAICQSYNGGSSYLCHTVFPCLGSIEPAYAMRNELGEVSSHLKVDGQTSRKEQVQGISGNYASPAEYMQWLQVASRATFQEAQALALGYDRNFEGRLEPQVFRAKNGWYVIVLGMLDDHFNNAEQLREMKVRGEIPIDSVLANGSAYAEAIPFRPGETTVELPFQYGTALRDTRIGGETQPDGSRYIGEEVVRMGEQVGVWSKYGNDCNISAHGLLIIACSDIEGFVQRGDFPSAGVLNSPEPSATNAQKNLNTAAPRPAYSGEDIRYWALYDDINGDQMRSYMTSRALALSRTGQFLGIGSLLNYPQGRPSTDLILEEIRIYLSDFLRLSEVLSVLETGDGAWRNDEHGDLYTLYIMNRARTKNQSASFAYEDLLVEGFTLEPGERSVFHAIGLNETQIEKWTHRDGREYVYERVDDDTLRQIFDGKNDGTYNYCLTGVCHTVMDVLPWVLWGATERDDSTPEERAELLLNSGRFIPGFDDP